MKRVAFFILLMLLSAPACLGAETIITLLNFADIYEIHPTERAAGLKSLKTLIEEEKRKNAHTFVLVSGDVLRTNKAEKKEKGKAVIDILNQFKVDIVSLGNHEFAFGLEELKKRIQESDFFWLASNVKEFSGQQIEGTLQDKIYDIDGIKIGFFALCLPEAQNSYPLECYEKVAFEPIMESACKAISGLKAQGADVIIAMTHLTLEQDKLLANTFKDIAVILGAHDHRRVSLYEKDTLIHKAGADGNFLGRVDLKIEKKEDGIKIYPTWSTICNLEKKMG